MRPMRRRSNRGSTLIEIMISMAVVLVGMLAMFGVLRSSIGGSSTAQKMMQAQTRAVTVMEAIRNSPNAALVCLTTTTPGNWSNCETTCQQALTVKNPDACIYTMQSLAGLHAPDVTGLNNFDVSGNGQLKDRHGQLYALDGDPNTGTRVSVAGANNSIYDIRIVVGWNDDGGAGTGAGYHTVTLRSGVLPGSQ